MSQSQSFVYPLSLNFNQVVDIVLHLPPRRKIELSRVLEKDAIESRTAAILSSVKDNSISHADILTECRQARKTIARKTRHANNR